MSAIFGIFNLDGRPVCRETLNTVPQAMSYWGPDGCGTRSEGSVGLGRLMLYNPPESLHEKLPRHSLADGLVMTTSARIANRDDLFQALDVPPPERRIMPDSEPILKAYQKWGEGCPDRCVGDWACAIWNSRQQQLFLARDHHGNMGLYYYQMSRCFVFASSLKGLLAFPEVPRRPEALRIAQVLVSWPEYGAPTCYQQILRLPPAHAMTVTAEKTDVQRYWDLEPTPEVHLGSDGEDVEAFLERYSKAVRCRLRSHRGVGVTLSGGLDSGSVAALAAGELRKKGAQRMSV